jgi:competence protein ComEC
MLLQLQVELPSKLWVIAIPILLLPHHFFPRVRPLIALAFGFLWALLHAHSVMDYGISDELHGKDVYVEGVVVSLTESNYRRTRFEFQIDRMELNGSEQRLPGRVQVSWYRFAPKIVAGQRWGLVLRLKRPHGFANPGGFDYEGWLLQRGIRASGYVRKSKQNRLLEEGGLLSIQRWRQQIRDKINTISSDTNGAALLNGLVIGDRSGIKQPQWQIFTRTGTNHLIAISGLHIGIVFGFIFFVVRRVWALSKYLPLVLPSQQAASLSGLVAAMIYAAMAGFAIPTQRAMIMLLVFVFGYFLRRPPRPTSAMSTALLLVVIWDPLTLLSAGFWLSFSAVTAIFFGFTGRVGKISLLQQWGRVQWMIALGLAPVLLAMSFQISLLAPLVNMVVVPLFSIIIVPLSLFAVLLLFLFEPLGIKMVELVGWILAGGMDGLSYLASIPFVVWTTPELPIWVWPFALIGVVLLLSPRGLSARWLGLLFLAPIMFIRPIGPEHGTVKITVLDVGQGLAVVIQTQTHSMLYDLGPKFSDDFNTGSAVVLPYMRSVGIDMVDLLMLSHGDTDHSGGLSGVLGQLGIASVLSGEPEELNVDANLCRAGESWSWDGVSFRILHPGSDSRWKENNSSCVLKIETAGRSLLIPGDIEKAVEKQMVKEKEAELDSDLVIIPHHGSKSSSSAQFIRAVSPKYAIVSAGYRNRYGFPNDKVVERWRSVGAVVLNTADLGAIEVEIDANGNVSTPIYHRLERLRYWHQPLIPRM